MCTALLAFGLKIRSSKIFASGATHASLKFIPERKWSGEIGQVSINEAIWSNHLAWPSSISLQQGSPNRLSYSSKGIHRKVFSPGIRGVCFLLGTGMS
ncbi:hypothetical protein MRB53_026508 [Persea americana]|uniref:Uncharacterized protein n=1 Tax=Persea americana TaxID=3435 RepID=A0ACC2LIE0_PERAE|nr:hypothetical protein MRB53_026508 [Persea americana]